MSYEKKIVVAAITRAGHKNNSLLKREMNIKKKNYSHFIIDISPFTPFFLNRNFLLDLYVHLNHFVL